MIVGLTKIRSDSILIWQLESPRTRHHTSNDNCIDGQFLRNNTTRRPYRFIILQWHHICALASQISINSTLCSTAFRAYNRDLIFAQRDLAFMSPGFTNFFSFPQIIAIFCSRIGRAVFTLKRLLSFTVITINDRQADLFTINQRWLSIITLIPVIRQTTKENIIWSWNWNIIIYKLHRFSLLHDEKAAMAIVLLLFCCSWKLNYRE